MTNLTASRLPVTIHLCSICAFAALSFTSLLRAQDWPQYLGPDRNSTSPQKNLLRSWPEGGPEVLWRVEVGKGYGGPVVRDGKVYRLDRDDKVGDKMRCFDLASGKELWSFGYDSSGSVPFPGSRSVPVVDGNCVYSCGPNGDLYCIDINTRKPLWKKNVWTDYGGTKLPIWAISQNPLVYENLLIIASQAPQAGVVAYNKLTGDVVWKTANLGNETYASPTIIRIDGKDHVVMVTSATNKRAYPDAEMTLGNVVGIEPLTGKILWTFPNWNCKISVAPAADAGENRILMVGGYELGATMIKVDKKADGSYEATELFTTEEFGDHLKPPILHNGYFYAQYGTNSRQDGLTCMSMDGKIMWKTKKEPRFDKGSMILADGLILATDGRKMLYLIEPDPAGFKALASSDLLADGGVDTSHKMTTAGGTTQNWAPIALADGKLLIRSQLMMLCVKVAK